MNRPLLATVVLTLGLGGCGDDDDGAGPPAPPAVVAALPGTYALTTTIDVPLTVLAPAPAASALATLSGLHRAPAATIFALLDQAGAPAVEELHQSLPGPLQGRLDGWINQYVEHASFQGRPVAAELAELSALASHAVTHFDLLTDLTAPDPASGAPATRTLRSVRLDGLPGHQATTFELLPAAIVAGTTQARPRLRLDAPRAGNDGLLIVGDHAFGLPLGQYAVAALDLALQERYGQDLGGALATLVDCPALAASVAHDCVGPVCVGHESQLGSLCARGLAEAATRVRAELAGYDFKAIHFVSGSADFETAGQLARGVWQANLDVGAGERTVPATFAGARR